MINMNDYDTYLSNLDLNITNNYTSNSSYLPISSKRLRNSELTQRTTTEFFENELNELDFGDDEFYSNNTIKNITNTIKFNEFFNE